MPRLSLFLVVGLLASSVASAQQGCPPIQLPPPDPAKLLFTPKQEMEIGEIIRWFGYHPQLSHNGRRLSMANGRGHLLAYDLPTLKQVQDLYFPDSISAHAWSADGSKLFVLTNDQTVFEIPLSANTTNSARN